MCGIGSVVNVGFVYGFFGTTFGAILPNCPKIFPRENDIGSFFVNVIVEDIRGGRTNYNFTLNVKDLNDPPAWFDVPADTIMNEKERYHFDVNATDSNDDILTYAISTDPSTDIKIDRETGVITWTATLDPFTPPYNVLYVNIEVSDGKETIFHNFTISIITNSTEEPMR